MELLSETKQDKHMKIFDLDNAVLIQNESLKKGQTYRFKKITENYVLLPFNDQLFFCSFLILSFF